MQHHKACMLYWLGRTVPEEGVSHPPTHSGALAEGRSAILAISPPGCCLAGYDSSQKDRERGHTCPLKPASSDTHILVTATQKDKAALEMECLSTSSQWCLSLSTLLSPKPESGRRRKEVFW